MQAEIAALQSKISKFETTLARKDSELKVCVCVYVYICVCMYVGEFSRLFQSN